MGKRNIPASIYETLAGIILPEGILEMFEVSHVEEKHTGERDKRGVENVVINIYLDEREAGGGRAWDWSRTALRSHA